MIWSAIGPVIERFLATLLLLFFGVLNAQSWVLLIAFGALGVIFDIAAAHVLGSATKAGPNATFTAGFSYKKAWRQIGYCAVAFVVLGLAIIWTATVLSNLRPSVIDEAGPSAGTAAGAFIAILRDHYEDLVTSGFASRANLVAVCVLVLLVLCHARHGAVRHAI